MKNKIFTILLTLLGLTGGLLQAQTMVQAGISKSGTSLIISAKPDDILTGNYSAGNVTIIWPTNYGISLGTITSTFGGPWVLSGGVQTSGSDSFVDIAWAGGSYTINSWTSGSINELFSVAVNQTGSGTGTFTITNNVGYGWYFEVGGSDFTNNSNPFFANSVSDVPLPVELNSFTATSKQNVVNLKWQTTTEVNNYGFEIERASSSTMPIQVWEKVGFVNGNGNSNSPKTYSYSDNNPSGGSKFLYRLKQIDNDGQFEYSDAIEVEIVPKEFALYQNYPNPFNPTTKINYSVPFDSRVAISIYSITGEFVTELVNDNVETGSYSVDFDGSNLASGMYIYKMAAGSFVKTYKMMLMK
jgi:hypothetical protein